MKKLIFTLFVGVALSTVAANSAKAQDYKHAIGGRFGDANGITFKTALKKGAMLELIGDFNNRKNYSYVNLTALYEIYNPIKGAEGLNWYYGFGGTIGSAREKGFDGEISLGANGVIGLDYKFSDAPINLSLDWIPTFQLAPNSGFYSTNVGLGVRFTF